MAVFDAFWDEFMVAHDRLPVWLPGMSMSVGDVGVIGRRGWQRITSLRELGVNFKVRNARTGVSYAYASKDAVDIQLISKGGVTSQSQGGEVAGGLNVNFKRGGAFVIRAENCHHEEIENLLLVESEIHALGDRWRRRSWTLVSHIVTAQPCIVLLAESAGASATVEIRANGGLAGLAEIASGRGSLRLARESALAAHVTSVQRIPLMWRGRRKRAWPLQGVRDLSGSRALPLDPPSDGTIQAPYFEEFRPSSTHIFSDSGSDAPS